MGDVLRPARAGGHALGVALVHAGLGTEPFETLRTASLASEVLTRQRRREPARPRPHLRGAAHRLRARARPRSSSAPSRSPTTSSPPPPRAAERLGFRPVLTPTEVGDERFADIVAPGGPDAGLAQFDEDLSPPTDDRPFFFQMATLGTFLSGEGFSNDLVFRPVLVLGSLALAVLLLAAVCIGGPLVHMGRRTRHAGMAPFYLYFAGIGLGFMLVEFSQLQRLNTFLGHPTYALAVVLFSVLLFSGIGSMLVEKVIDPDRPRTLLVPVGGAARGDRAVPVHHRAGHRRDGGRHDVRAGGHGRRPAGARWRSSWACRSPSAWASPRGAPAPPRRSCGASTGRCRWSPRCSARCSPCSSASTFTFGAGFVAYAVAAAALVLIVRLAWCSGAARRRRRRLAGPASDAGDAPDGDAEHAEADGEGADAGARRWWATGRSGQPAAERLDDAGGLGPALDLHRDDDGRLDAAGDVVAGGAARRCPAPGCPRAPGRGSAPCRCRS